VPRRGKIASEEPLALLLLPRTLDEFILREQARDLLRAPGVVAADPPKVPYGAFGRMPEWLAEGLAGAQAGRLALPGRPRAIVMFHPLQLYLARALLRRHEGAELWYGRWDRYEHAYDASPKLRRRLERLHEQAAELADLTFVASGRLAELEREEGRQAELVGLTSQGFPAPEAAGAVIAVSLGHLGHRTDWALLRAVAERMPELVLLLVGERHDDEMKGDEDFAACTALPNLVWLGRRSDEEAARLILCADAGIVPFKVDPFNDAGLPYRIVKYAALGRHTISPPLEGVRTWDHAVTVADGADEWVAALRARAGARTAPDLELREWALGQTAVRVNEPLWRGLRRLRVPLPGDLPTELLR
jgi:hypothetical protein